MSPARFKQLVRRELQGYLRENALDEATFEKLIGRYPASRWDWHSLGRWLAIFGAISMAAGATILARELFAPTLEKLAVLLAIALATSVFFAQRLKARKLEWTGKALELLGGFTLIGLTFTLGIIYSSGSGNWPALLLIDLILLLLATYLLNNLLLLILSLVVFFSWFGGFTGYASGWGAYWFGMNYPLRFLCAALAMIALSLAHYRAEAGLLQRYRGFFKVWLSGGVFFAEMSLWLMSLFGNFGDASNWSYRPGVAVLVFFNLLWAGANALLLTIGVRYDMRMLRGYGATFLLIQAYTLYFWHIAGHLGPVLGLLIGGGSMLWLVVYLEQQRRAGKRP
ncbi:MAG: hypothetical protein OET44_13230 [Gammaproteobacteria bacterium]|nr:hypothetical protein [Gammaproteobacteria bacterium]